MLTRVLNESTPRQTKFRLHTSTPLHSIELTTHYHSSGRPLQRVRIPRISVVDVDEDVENC
jgi:hypothetical protein